MKRTVVFLLMIGGGCALADVYKWTDAHGEVHYGETAPSPNSDKVMTQEQILQTERTDQARPKTSLDTDAGIDEEVQQRMSQCQYYKNLRNDYLMSMDRNVREGIGWRALGIRSYSIAEDNDNTANLTGFSQIEAGVRKYCQD